MRCLVMLNNFRVFSSALDSGIHIRITCKCIFLHWIRWTCAIVREDNFRVFTYNVLPVKFYDCESWNNKIWELMFLSMSSRVLVFRSSFRLYSMVCWNFYYFPTDYEKMESENFTSFSLKRKKNWYNEKVI